jgi:hypothetical protein
MERSSKAANNPSTHGILPATAAQAALLTPLIERLLTPGKSPFDVEQLPLIRADAPEFVALKITPHPQFLGLDPNTTPLAAVISLATPSRARREIWRAHRPTTA